MYIKSFFPRYHLHMLLAFYKNIWMWLAKAAFKDQCKLAGLVFEKTAFVTLLRVMRRFHEHHVVLCAYCSDYKYA